MIFLKILGTMWIVLTLVTVFAQASEDRLAREAFVALWILGSFAIACIVGLGWIWGLL